jgi:hypothetical protein
MLPAPRNEKARPTSSVDQPSRSVAIGAYEVMKAP